MDRETFWSVIARVREQHPNQSTDDIANAVVDELSRLPPEEIESFQSFAEAYRYAANRRELWAVVSYICGGCGDDGFDYHRGWLIAQGETVYFAAMNDPSSLALHHWVGDDAKFPDMECEMMLYAARKAFENVTGRDMRRDRDLPEIEEAATWPADRVANYKWTDDDVAKLFPRLTSRWKRVSR
jgi:hypothetical protein